MFFKFLLSIVRLNLNINYIFYRSSSSENKFSEKSSETKKIS